jgi:hypothetical protein
MTGSVLSRLALNRALLERQLLLRRATLGVAAAVEHLVGLQAQVVNPPYIGLWTRLEAFERALLTRSMEERQVVRAALMRSTLHLFSADDFLRFRSTLQPALTKGLNSFHGRNIRGMEVERIVEAGRAALAATPQSFSALHPLLLQLEPDRLKDALDYTVRTYLPLVQVFPAGSWKKGGSPAYALTEQYLGRAVDAETAVGALFRRYLAAFGPASVMDFQTWSGMSKLSEAVEPLRGELRVFRDEQGVELFDLPDAPLPAGDIPAPVRFLPEYDNLLIGHADRTRTLSDVYRNKVFLTAGRVRSVILVDGFVRGAWKSDLQKGTAILTIEPFESLSSGQQDALAQEGERLLRFIEDGAKAFEVRFAPVA